MRSAGTRTVDSMSVVVTDQASLWDAASGFGITKKEDMPRSVPDGTVDR